MQSEYFAIRTEPVAVGDTITEFIKRLLDENEKLERENQEIALRNLECERRLQTGEVEGFDKDCIVGQWGRHISEYEIKMRQMRAEEASIVKREKHFERDTQDLIEYVQWITGDLGLLRDRARVSEKVISDLKRSGEESVDSLMETLSMHKHKQDSLDREVDHLRVIINEKEQEIAAKEDEVNRLKRMIELETNEKEVEIRRIKTEIEEQNKVIDTQQKIIHELQVLNDYTQADLIQANNELQSRIRERNDLHLKFQDADHETTNLMFK